jgi:Holliday junction resolvasome RuvABC endonuclease subunit
VEGALGKKATLIPPGRWKASYGLSGGNGGKVDSMRMVERLLGVNGAVNRHDEAEAVLIAWWGWRNILLLGDRAGQADDLELHNGSK